MSEVHNPFQKKSFPVPGGDNKNNQEYVGHWEKVLMTKNENSKASRG